MVVKLAAGCGNKLFFYFCDYFNGKNHRKHRRLLLVTLKLFN